jgi:predicted dienelactone hydrolase
MRAVLAALRESAFAARIDWSRVGLMGHSLGGYTALGLIGAWESWRMPEARAALALSPFCQPYLDEPALARIAGPVAYQGGTRDLGVTPAVRRPDGCFAQTGGRTYYVEFTGVGHFGWTDMRADAHPLMLSDARAFFDRELRGLPGDQLTAETEGVSEVREK